LELGADAMGQQTRIMGLPDGQKSLQIGLAVDTIPACDGQTDRQTYFDGKDQAIA